MGQMVHFVRARRIIDRVLDTTYDDALVTMICDHIVDFSLNGLRGGEAST